MHRRTVLKLGGMAALGLGVPGCASRLSPSSMLPAGRPLTLTLPIVRASWDRVIRTTVGLRPYRPAGLSMWAVLTRNPPVQGA